MRPHEQDRDRPPEGVGSDDAITHEHRHAASRREARAVRLDDVLASTTRDLTRGEALASEVSTPSAEVLPMEVEEQALEALTTPTEWKPAQPDQNERRRRRQAVRGPRVVEDGAQSVRKPRATTLLVPAEKRCEALTTAGARCKAPKLRGLRVCMFHGHLAHDDERLAALADPNGSDPGLSPRRAMKAVAALRAGEIATTAVAGALRAAEKDGGAALLRVVDAVDPAREETASLRLTADEVGALSFADLTLAVRSLVEGGRTTTDPLTAS